MQNGYELHSVHFLGFQKLLQRSKKDTQLSYGEEEYTAQCTHFNPRYHAALKFFDCNSNTAVEVFFFRAAHNVIYLN